MTFAQWAVLSACTFAFYLVVFIVLGSLNRWMNRRLGLAPAPQPEPPPGQAVSRRQILRVTKRAVVTGAAVGALGYPIAWEPQHYVISRRTFPLRGLPASLDGLRIVQLTDIHLGPWLSEGYVRRIVASANALSPDLLALTGDYVLHSPAYIEPVAGILAGLRAKVGIVGVLGNHDWREDGPAMRKVLAAAGVRMIDNDRCYVTPGRELRPESTETAGLCLAGVGDLWTDRQLYDRALEGVPPAMPRLLLSHNPDVAEERAFVSSGYRVDLMLSGHTHGGQIYIPGLGTPVLPSHYGQKYASGLVRGPVCPVFVSCGLGTALLPIRVGVPPEIAVIELKRA
jgi:predicted MPP superfamily phosphohydrolase